MPAPLNLREVAEVGGRAAPLRHWICLPWNGWLSWSREQGIDYFIGRRLPTMLSELGLADIEATAETALYHGGSSWAEYWRETIIQLRPRLLASGKLSDRAISTFLAHCADRGWWTQTIAFTTVSGRTPTAE